MTAIVADRVFFETSGGGVTFSGGERRRLVSEGNVAVTPRIPLVPGITTTEKNLRAIVDLLRSMGIRSCVVLGYNPFGLAKWETIGKEAPVDAPEGGMPLGEEGRLRRKLVTLLNMSSGEGGAC